MIIPVFGLSMYIPSDYEQIIRKLRVLGLEPTGNKEVDKARLSQAVRKKAEKFELKKEVEQNNEKNIELEKMEENRTGAKILGELNRFLFGI